MFNFSDLIQSVKRLGLEELIAKRRDSRYEPSLRSAAWYKRKKRCNTAAGYYAGCGNHMVKGQLISAHHMMVEHHRSDGVRKARAPSAPSLFLFVNR
jgi:ATP-dependent DNA ligase